MTPDDLASAAPVRNQRKPQRRSPSTAYLAAAGHAVCFLCAVWVVLGMSFARSVPGGSGAFLFGLMTSCLGYANEGNSFLAWLLLYGGALLVGFLFVMANHG